MNSNLLKRSLQANGAFSLASATILLAGTIPLSAAFGLPEQSILIAVGISLFLFAIGLFRNAAREEIHLGEAKIAVALDVAWLVGTAIVLATGLLTPSGNLALILVADFVFVFALLQALGIVRIRKSQPAC